MPLRYCLDIHFLNQLFLKKLLNHIQRFIDESLKALINGFDYFWGMKAHHIKHILLASFALGTILTSSSCKRTGCKKDVPCVDNFDAKAEKAGDCQGCTVFGAYNYCPEADLNSNRCVFVREFYSEYGTDGWIDVWVADSSNNSAPDRLRYEGKISSFPVRIPECESSDSSLSVVRRPGEYYYEIETQTGILEWGWVIFREEGCRLLDVY